MAKAGPTIIDVARRAGVSKSTVSRVLNDGGARVRETTRLKVLQAIEELGYERNAVARSLRTASTETVMLAIPDITNPFWPEVARGVQDRMEEAGYSVVFANSDWQGERERKFLGLAKRQRFDGILINPIQVSAEELASTGIPTVLIGLRDSYSGLDMVGSDTFGATVSALEYLASLGHERIGLILGRHSNRSSHSRLGGYLHFLRSRGIPFDDKLVVEVTFERQGGAKGIETLLEAPDPPTAVLAANDIVAIGALQRLHEMGVEVPGEISIMGIDDIEAASMSIPPLTTIAKQKYALGYKAADMLLDRIRNGAATPPRREVIPCQIVVRGSTGERRRKK
jgi:DNA-binding LacI/PurR family transcriptional regulator